MHHDARAPRIWPDRARRWMSRAELHLRVAEDLREERRVAVLCGLAVASRIGLLQARGRGRHRSPACFLVGAEAVAGMSVLEVEPGDVASIGVACAGTALA